VPGTALSISPPAPSKAARRQHRCSGCGAEFYLLLSDNASVPIIQGSTDRPAHIYLSYNAFPLLSKSDEKNLDMTGKI